ncbi:ZC12A-like protein, partial [Mya arenaria]
NYIQAICNPGERKVVEFPQSALKELTDPQTLEYIEAKTNAFIRPLEKIAEFEISGTELAVTLALSEIEELAGSAVKERSGEVTDEQTDGGVIEISPLKGNTKKRLSDQLQRALSNHSDGICSVDDYKETSAAVQRVLVNCLEDEDNDIDDDDLFSDGKDGGKDFSQTFQVKIYDDEPDSSESFKTCDEYDIKPTTDVLEISRKLGSTSLSKSQKSETPDIKPTTDVLEISRKLGSTSLSKSQKSETPDTAKADQALNEQQEYLRSFGLNLGFNDQDVNHALNMIDEKTRPSDFFDLLNIVKQQTGNDSTVADNTNHELDTSGDDVIIEGETIEYFTKEKSTEEVSNTVKGASAADSSKSEQTTLPETYKERLMMDFFQEDDTCDIEELKRRNAERQKLLKLNFEKQGQAENQIESKGKKKRRGKQKKNKQQSSSGECAPMAVCENSTFSNDMEQTCRLRIWSDDDSGKITGENNASELDEFRTPNNRKNRSQSAGNQQQEQQMSLQYGKGRGQNPQGWHSSQNTPNKPTQRGNSYSEVAQGNKRYGSPGRAQFGSPGKGQRQYQKPMQVVNPVNVVGQARVEAPQGVVKPAELRYIVIDGSNVAMTHGNGKEFSCKGIQVCVDYFKQRGHQKITVFVPNWRNCHPSPENMIVDQHILKELKEDGTMVFTPSRRIGRKLVAAYDDRFVVELAEAEDAIIVSNDQYRDLMTEKATWKTIIETRLLMYSFVRDRFMPPNDPLGRDGPCLDQFLTVTQDTP